MQITKYICLQIIQYVKNTGDKNYGISMITKMLVS